MAQGKSPADGKKKPKLIKIDSIDDEKYKECYFCKRAATLEEKKKGHCSVCKTRLELKRTPFNRKRIVFMVVLTIVPLIISGLLTLGIYVGATAKQRKIPEWHDKGWASINDSVNCDFYKMRFWSEWSPWFPNCGLQMRQRTRKVWAKGIGCPATTMNQTEKGAPCCKGEWQSTNKSNYDYCFRPYNKLFELKNFEDALNECHQQESSMAVPINESQAIWFRSLLGKKHWLGIRLNSHTSQYQYLDPEFEKEGSERLLSYAKSNYFIGSKAKYVFSEENEELAIIAYNRCVEERKTNCVKNKIRTVWHSTNNKNKKLAFLCKRYQPSINSSSYFEDTKPTEGNI